MREIDAELLQFLSEMGCAIMASTDATATPCEHSRRPDWENRLWQLVSGELTPEEEETYLAEIQSCTYCRAHLARCAQAELEARDDSTAHVAPRQQDEAASPMRLVIGWVRDGLKLLEGNWSLSPEMAAGVRSSGVSSASLHLEKQVGAFDIRIDLIPAHSPRISLAFMIHSHVDGLPTEGFAELYREGGLLLESIEVQSGRGQFRPVAPGNYRVCWRGYTGDEAEMEVILDQPPPGGREQ